jgi:hypothetical protein
MTDKLNTDLIDQLLKDCNSTEDVLGENGLLKQLAKAILERALQTEFTTSATKIIPYCLIEISPIKKPNLSAGLNAPFALVQRFTFTSTPLAWGEEGREQNYINLGS